MGLIFISLMVCICVILYLVSIKFDEIKVGDDVMYYEDHLPVHDKVKCVYDGGIITKGGKDFTYWDFLKGEFFKINNQQND